MLQQSIDFSFDLQKLLIETSNVEYMAFNLSLSTLLMSVSFFTYGFLGQDRFVYVSIWSHSFIVLYVRTIPPLECRFPTPHPFQCSLECRYEPLLSTDSISAYHSAFRYPVTCIVVTLTPTKCAHVNLIYMRPYYTTPILKPKGKIVLGFLGHGEIIQEGVKLSNGMKKFI